MPPWSAALLLSVARAAQAPAPPPSPPSTTCIGRDGACVLGGVSQGACCCPNSCFQQHDWYSQCLPECPTMAQNQTWACNNASHHSSHHCQSTFTEYAALKLAVVAFDANAVSAAATYGPISGWDVSAITDMSGLFTVLAAFNADISGWETSGVTDMSAMFSVRSARALHPIPNRALACTLHAPAASPRPPASRPACPLCMSPFRYGRGRQRSTSRLVSTRPASQTCTACLRCAPRLPCLQSPQLCSHEPPPTHALTPTGPHAARIACPPFDSAVRGGVQPVAELRHVRGH